jgi:predicted DNA-binding protein (MmcQ/YjbR family)
MTWEQLRDWCLSFAGVVETFPFEPGWSVFKAANGKMFAISSASSVPLHVTVKCDPVLAEALRRDHRAIVEGYHVNKRHWITITIGDDVPDARVRELIEDSFALVM